MACAPYSLSITELKTAVESGTRKLLDGGSLRYCPPSAGGWGIIRDGLLVPESIMLFISPAGCGRHGAIAGLQLGFRQRLFFLYVDEVDLVTGRHLERAKEAVEEILASISRPRAIMICATCIDDLLVSDYEKLAEQVENDYRIPARACHMNPIAMDGKNPTQLTIQKAIHEFIPAVKPKEQAINMLGSFAAINRGSEFYELMARAGVSPVRHIAACSTFDDLCSMGRSFYNVLIKPGGKLAAEYMAKALDIPYCYAPVSYGLEAIAASYRKLEEQLGISLDTAAYYEKTEKAINYYRKILGSISIAAEGDFPCGLNGEAPIILLDEATASLDPENETLIQQAVGQLIQDKTVLIIAHRLRSVENCDQIVVLNNGKVQETGTHAQLMEKQGLYHHLFELQRKSAEWSLNSATN